MVDYANKELLCIDSSNHTLESIVIFRQDVKDVLLHLNVTPILFKQGTGILSLPYSIILIMDTFPKLGKK